MSSELERLQQALPQRYSLLRELDRGGMSRVYLAREELPDRQVAIKMLDEELSARLGRERFVREVEVTSRLGHPYIVPILAAGEADGTLYYVMPFIEGDSLRTRLEREGRLTIDEAVRIATEVADALEHAHKSGIIHRDIKPSNILFQSGHAVVADFGIARALSVVEGSAFTQSGLPIGTPDYMSPEQIDAQGSVDARTDVYALGCILFEMIGGQPPFLSRTPQATLARHMADPVPSLRTLRDSVPPSVEAVARTALCKEPADRYQSAAEFARALREATVPAVVSSEPRTRIPSFGTSARVAGTLLVVAAIGLAWQAWSSRVPAPVSGAGRYVDSVAVMPFGNRTGQASLDPLGQSIADEVIRHLATVPSVKVTDSYSVSSLYGQQLGTAALLDTLGVGTLINGYYVRRGDDLFITISESDESGAVGWTETYSSNVSTLEGDQLEIAHSVAEAFLARIGVVATLDDIDESYGPGRNAYITANGWLGQRTPGAMAAAVASFSRAIALEPDYAPAHAGLSSAYALTITYKYAIGATAYELAEMAIRAADSAVALDPTFAGGYSSRGYILALLGANIDRAEQDFATAQELAPSGPNGLSWAARIATERGRTAEAYEQARLAVEIDPISAGRRLAVAILAFQLGNYEVAVTEARAALGYEPTLAFATGTLARSLAMMDRGRECLDLGLGPYEAIRAICLLQMGRTEDAEEVASAAARSIETSGSGLYAPELVAQELASYHALRGDRDQALRWIEYAFERSPAGLDARILGSPMFERLREDGQFVAEVARIRAEALRWLGF